MRDFIVKALKDAAEHMEPGVPKTKKETVFVNIENVSHTIINLVSFMQENDIPDSAVFTHVCSCSATHVEPGDYLTYQIDVETTEKERDEYRRRRFDQIAFKKLYDLLTAAGYKRVGFNSGLLKQFKDTTIYDMFLEKDWDRLEKRYSLSFHLAEEV